MLRSNLGYIGVGVQTAKGTEMTTPEWYPKYLDDKFASDISVEHLREAGDGELLGLAIKTGYKEKFGWTQHARPETVARLFAYLLGKDTKTGAADPYTHTIIRSSTNERAWLTLRRKLDTNVVQVLKDARISKITLSGEAGKPLKIDVEGDALSSFIYATETTPTYETLKPFVFYDGIGTFTLEGAVNKNIKSFSIGVSIGTEMLQTDEMGYNDLPDLRLDIDVSISLYVSDTTIWKKALYNNLTSPQRDVYTGAFEIDLSYIDSGPKARECKVTIPSFEWKPVSGMNLNSEGKPMLVTLAGVGVKPVSGEIITVVAKNDIATAIYHA